MPTFETERLTLRRYQIEAAEPLHREIYSDHGVVCMCNGDKVFTIEQVQEFLPRRRNTGQWGYWTVLLKETGKVIGQVHLDPYANLNWFHLQEEPFLLCKTPEVHLGFAFGRRFWGHGYALEACRELIRYAFSDLHLPRLLGGADARNARSIRLYERLGYRLYFHPDRPEGVTTLLNNPLASYRLRPFEERDREVANRLRTPVIDWWHKEIPEAALHLVVEVRETGEVEPYVAALYSKWEEEFLRRDPTTVFLAWAPVTGEIVGVVTALEWYFTGTRPDWCGRGIATALKVRCLQEAKARGIAVMETENHEDNAAMLAINRKLGFVFAASEVACIKRLS